MAGATRKLQQEIDRTLKYVEQGCRDFDAQLETVRTAESQVLKERHEEDLKREIKKLQKYRDQIKAWVSSPDVKIKDPLVEARTLIERRMEAFKVVERETKTKAYSKEGLLRDSALTPEERKRAKTREWLGDLVQRLSDDVDATEAAVEALDAPGGGGGKAKKDKEGARLAKVLAAHRWHTDRLEALTRMLDNGTVEPDAVDGIKEDLEYYLEQCKEEDFELDTEFYDVFETLTLGDEDAGAVARRARRADRAHSAGESAV